MANKDTMVGIVGAAVLVAAMVGIFYFEGARAPGAGTGGPVAGPTPSPTEAVAQTLTLQLGPGPMSAAEQTFDVPAGNWTSFTVKLSAAPSGGAPGWVADSIQVTLTGPGGESAPTVAWNGPQTGTGTDEITVDSGTAGSWTLRAESNALAGTGVTITADVAVVY